MPYLGSILDLLHLIQKLLLGQGTGCHPSPQVVSGSYAQTLGTLYHLRPSRIMVTQGVKRLPLLLRQGFSINPVVAPEESQQISLVFLIIGSIPSQCFLLRQLRRRLLLLRQTDSLLLSHGYQFMRLTDFTGFKVMRSILVEQGIWGNCPDSCAKLVQRSDYQSARFMGLIPAKDISKVVVGTNPA